MLADIPSGLPLVMADPAMTERVVANLVSNALRHAPAAVPLVTAGTRGDRVELRVVDQGPGISWFPAAWPRRRAAPWNQRRLLAAG